MPHVDSMMYVEATRRDQVGSERRFLEGLQQAVLMTGNTLCNWPTHVSHGTRALLLDIGPLRRNFSAFATASCATRESPKFGLPPPRDAAGKRQVAADRSNSSCSKQPILFVLTSRPEGLQRGLS